MGTWAPRSLSIRNHGNFRHLVVLESGEIVGVLAMRDIVRSWVSARVPAS